MPLSHLRVLELGTLLAGPFTGRLLADFGADVIKIEAPGTPDPMRAWGKRTGDGEDGLWWPIQSRNKKSITLDLRLPEGQEVFKELVRESDVIVENFRPGTLERWGLSYDVLQATNPEVIVVRTSGFGQTGPYSHRAGFGSIAEAMGGLRYVTGFPDRPPTRVGISIGDSLAGLFAAIGCLVALIERERSRQGQVVDTAIYEAVFAMMESIVPDYVLADHVRERTGAIIPGVSPSNIYKTSDGTFVVIGANADGVFRRLTQAIGRPELAEDPRYRDHHARSANMVELDETIEAWTAMRSAQECLAALEHHGVPAGPIYSVREIVEDEHYRAREMIVPIDHPTFGSFPMPGIVPKLSRTPGRIERPGSTRLGEDNAAVYQRLLAYTADDLQGLSERGVI